MDESNRMNERIRRRGRSALWDSRPSISWEATAKGRLGARSPDDDQRGEGSPGDGAGRSRVRTDGDGPRDAG